MSDDTRSLVRSTALRLFRERGYAATTMRAIAQEAGVSTGNAYYHFESKDHLVQELYLDVNREHVRRAQAVLAAGGDLSTSACAGSSWRASTPSRSTTRSAASSSRSPSGPARRRARSRRSRPQARALSQELFRRAGRGSAAHGAVRCCEGELPELLWLVQLGVTLFWVYDASEGQRRTRTLVNGLAPLLGRLVRLTRLPVLRGAAEDVLALVRAVKA